MLNFVKEISSVGPGWVIAVGFSFILWRNWATMPRREKAMMLALVMLLGVGSTAAALFYRHQGYDGPWHP